MSANPPDEVPMSPVEDPAASLLAVPYFDQKDYADLCWAACCDMILAFNQLASPPLCALAGEAFNINCCSDPPDDGCDAGHWPDDIYSARGISFLRSEGSLTLGNIIYEIDRRRPIHAVLQWGDDTDGYGAKHLIVVCGYYPNGDVLVKDPLYGVGRLGYDYIRTAYNMGRWSDSYYGLKRQ